MRKQVLRSSLGFSVAPGKDKTPQGTQRTDERDHAKKILVCGNTAIHRDPGPTVVRASQVRVVLDEQNGNGDEDKSRPAQKTLGGSEWVPIGQHD